jgi:hypothetical protein
MPVVVELLLLLIEAHPASQRTVHDVLGVKFVLLNLINEELQRNSDFEEQYIQDCLWLLLNVCGVSNQGAMDVVAANGVDLLYFLCETKPSLVSICLQIMRALLSFSPAVMLPPFLSAENLKQL